MSITTNVPTISTQPNRNSPATFSADTDTYHQELNPMIDAMNDVAGEMNTVASEVNANKNTTQVNTDLTSSNTTIAINKANEAEASAVRAESAVPVGDGYNMDTVDGFNKNQNQVENSTDGGYPEYKIKSKNFVFGDTPETLHENSNIKLINNEYFKDEGVELVINGDFSNGTTGWLPTSNSIITTNNAILTLDANGNAYGGFYRFVNTVVGKTYSVKVDVLNINTGTLNIIARDSGGSTIKLQSLSARGSADFTFVAISSSTRILVEPSNQSNMLVNIDNISVKELTAITLPTAPAPVVETSTTTANTYAKGDVVVLDRPELVTGNDSTFDTAIGNWTDASSAGGSIAWNASQNIDVINTTGTARARLSKTTVIGQEYVYNIKNITNNLVWAIGNTAGGSEYDNGTDTGSLTVVFTATTTTTHFQLANTAGGTTVTCDNIFLKQKDEIYQAKTTTSVSDLLTDTAKFQVKTDVSIQDIVLNRKEISTGATSILTYRSLNVYGQADTNDDIMIGEGYSLVAGSKDTYTDGTYYVTLIGCVPRLNQGAYHPTYNPYGTYGFNKTDNWGIEWYRGDVITIATSVAECFATATSGVVNGVSINDIANDLARRPDRIGIGEGAKKIIEKGLNALVDRRIGTKQYSKAEMELKAESILRETREDYLTETEQFTQTTTGTVDTLEVSDGTKYPIGQVVQIYDRTASTVIGRRRVLSVNANTVTLDATIVKSANDYIIGGRISNQCVQGESLAIEVLSDNYKTDWLDRLSEGKALPIIVNFVDDAGVSNLPDGVKTVFKFQQKAKSNLQVLKSTDSGVTWTLQVLTTHYTIDTVANTITFVTAPLSTDMIVISNIADINPIHEATAKPVEYASDKAIASNSNDITERGDIVRAITGKVPVGSSANRLESKVLENALFDDNGVLQTTPKHTAFTLNSDDSPASKYYSTIANDNGQAIWQIEGEILEWNTINWGDNGEFDGVNNNNSDDNKKKLSARLPMKIKD